MILTIDTAQTHNSSWECDNMEGVGRQIFCTVSFSWVTRSINVELHRITSIVNPINFIMFPSSPWGLVGQELNSDMCELF